MTRAATIQEPSGVHGRLALAFERTPAGTTRETIVELRPPLALVRGFSLPDGARLVHVHNVSGGVLAGDVLDVAIDVGPGARAQLTTVGATQVYRSSNGAEAICSLRARVASGGLLEYLPDPLIPFAGSIFRQTTSVELESGAGLLWWEIVAPGRTARGELFAYERLRISTEIRVGTRPIALERFSLVPSERSLGSPLRLGEYGYFGSFFVCAAGLEAERWRALESDLTTTCAARTDLGHAIFGVSRLPADGVVVRALATSRRQVASVFEDIWRVARRELFGGECALPRKTR